MKYRRFLGLCLLAAGLCLVLGAPVRAAEQLVVGVPITVSPAEDAYQRTPDVAYGGGKYFMVWQDGWNGVGGDSNIMGIWLYGDGSVLSEPITICSAKGIQEKPSVAFLGGEFVVVWQDLRGGKDYDIYFARVNDDGLVGSEKPLVIMPHNQALPRIASNGKLALVVWQDLRDGESYRIYASRLDAKGRVLDGDGFQLLERAANTPAVAASEDMFLVSWTRVGGQGRVSGARVSLDGKVLGEFVDHSYHGGPSLPAVASDGQNFLFTCSRQPYPNYWGWGGASVFYASRILADGSAPDKDLISGRAPTGDNRWTYKLFANVLDCAKFHKGIWMHKYSDVTWNGKEYVAVWTRAHIQNRVMLTNFDLYATRIRFPGWQKLDSPTGPIPDKAWELDPQPIPGIPVADTPMTEAMPALCGGPPGKVLVAYELHQPDGAIEITTKMLTAP